MMGSPEKRPAEYGPIVDYSYRDLDTLTEAYDVAARPGLRPYTYTEQGRILSCSFRISNNQLQDISFLNELLTHVLADPTRLFWLDLSFNSLAHIHPVLTTFSNLQILYLHGNSINNLAEIRKLGTVVPLRSLTLHGNLVELEKGYRVNPSMSSPRSQVLGMIPQLKVLDFSAVTRQDRSTAAVLKAFERRSHTVRKGGPK
ncbi:leucine-rich repeat-containing protein 51 isoform X1 [Callorhinchus milii]|uniref:Leucine-rich repeat-containing protein 51 n=2 Tax=Callorhinchus milii TaxID=7868 RepID=V9LCI8_CALMI|nr:leucine-rich repeat-containing protein 51 isoform X1 [Callorhinchus milii]